MMDKHLETAPADRENETATEEPRVIEEIAVEELSIDGICGVY